MSAGVGRGDDGGCGSWSRVIAGWREGLVRGVKKTPHGPWGMVLTWINGIVFGCFLDGEIG